MAAEDSGGADYWVNLITINDGSETNTIFDMIPPHLINEVIRLLDVHYEETEEAIEKQFDKVKEETYKNDPVYGIDIVKTRDLAESAIKIDGHRQPQPWIRGKDTEEHYVLQRAMEDEESRTILEAYNRDTGSALGQTELLPHLFKEQPFFSHIADGLDRTIAVAKEGFSQFYFLTRTQNKISGSMFRSLAGVSPTSEIKAKDITVDSGEVIERRFDNMNPFRGKFTFKTAYGPPPTASLSPAVANATAFLDLGQKKHGPQYVVYNTSTGSLSTGSILYTEAGEGVLYHGVPIENSPLNPAAPFSSSIINGLQFNQSTNIKYQAKWEQNITSASNATLAINVRYVYVPYHPTIYNGKMNPLIRTRKTLSKNGSILIT